MAYSLDSSKDSCYPGTTVLVNKLGLQEQADLDAAERVAVAVHAVEIETAPPSGPFTFAYYLDLHRRLFQDLYNWAGTLRTINLSKKGTAFYPASELAELGDAKFRRLQSQHEFRGLTRSAFVAAIADFYHELNMLHPFREGNGRTQRLFFTLLIRRAGYDIDFSACDTDLLMFSTIRAAHGIMTYLEAFFDESITP